MATSPSLADLTATIASLQAQVAELTEHRNLQETIAPTASDPGYITGEEVDVFFLLFGGVLVFWMQAGFAMLEVGSVSKKNMKNILVKNFFDACVGAIMWWATGYALSSGNDTFRTSGNNGFAGTSAFFLDGNVGGTAGLKGGYTKIGWFFSFTFAATACTIVSGAIAERATFMAYALYSVILIGFVYPPV